MPWTGQSSAQALVRRQDLLDHEIEGPLDPLPQRRQIGFRVEQAVDVIDPETVDLARLEHAQRPRVRMLEHRRELHPEAGQIVDVEEAPVVDLVLGDAEERDPPELRGNQPVHLAPVAIERVDPLVDRRRAFLRRAARAPPVRP